MYGGDGSYMWGFGGGYLRERDHLQDQGVDVRVILKWIFKKWDGNHALD